VCACVCVRVCVRARARAALEVCLQCCPPNPLLESKYSLLAGWRSMREAWGMCERSREEGKPFRLRPLLRPLPRPLVLPLPLSHAFSSCSRARCQYRGGKHRQIPLGPDFHETISVTGSYLPASFGRCRRNLTTMTAASISCGWLFFLSYFNSKYVFYSFILFILFAAP